MVLKYIPPKGHPGVEAAPGSCANQEVGTHANPFLSPRQAGSRHWLLGSGLRQLLEDPGQVSPLVDIPELPTGSLNLELS